jgi:hypothetical protein
VAIGSLVLGIVALVILWIPGVSVAAVPISIIGIILGAVGSKKLKEAGEPTGVATGGLVISIIALVFSFIFTLICGACAAAGAGCLGVF